MSTATGLLGSRLLTETDWSWDTERVTYDDCRKFGRTNFYHESSDTDYVHMQWGVRTDDGDIVVCWTDPT